MRSFALRACSTALILFLFLPAALAAAESAFSTGVSLYQKRDFKNAAAYFIVAEKRGEQADNAIYYQALCWQQMGRNDLAKDLYSRLVTSFPTSPGAAQAKIALSRLTGVTATPANIQKTTVNTALTNAALCEVPYESVPAGMVLQIKIGGKTIKAIWDTGASGMFFWKSQLDEAGIDTRKCVKSGRATGIGGEVQIYQLDAPVQIGTEIQMLPLMVQDDTAEVRNGSARSEYGLIGQEFFGRYVYEVDPSAHVIRFLKRTTVSPRTPVVDNHRNRYDNLGEPFTWEDGVMIVRPKINGRECEMIWDTGASMVAFSDKQLSAAGITRPTDSSEALSYGVGGTRSAYGFQLTSVSLGPVSKSSVRANVAVHGSHPRPLLGQSFLGSLHYTVDPERRIITIQGR